MLHQRAAALRAARVLQIRRFASTGNRNTLARGIERTNQVATAGSGFPDFIHKYNADVFKQMSMALAAGTACSFVALGPFAATPYVIGIPTAAFIYSGYKDMTQVKHAVRKNFPVLGNVRYIFEILRPEIRQYFVEGDQEAEPFSREHRAIVYQRAKNMTDTVAFGTRRNVYEPGYEWAVHSLYPKHLDVEASRVMIGASNPGCTQPYSASLLNVSAMSYGALSNAAILALNEGAALGGFYHNTGEGGISRFHKEPGGDIVWNVGTGYFGCGTGSMERVFDPAQFRESAALPQVKMIELKLSQGAKPGHGGMLPKEKITPFIAEARGLGEPPYLDCNSPPRHSAFSDPAGLIRFVREMQELAEGKPVGFKLCIGRPSEFVDLVKEMHEQDFVPDFITVDGSEGGTGAAPHEFSNSLGMPLQEALFVVHNVLRGAGLRHRVKIISAGKVSTGFALVKHLAMGADLCAAARPMLFALGCIQALKCNTNTCPTGITTQNPDLIKGLHVPSKAMRVKQFQEKTVSMALEIIGA